MDVQFYEDVLKFKLKIFSIQMQRVHGVFRFNNGQIYINSRAQCEKLGAYRLRSCCEGGGWLLEFSLEKNRIEARKFPTCLRLF